MGFYRKIKYFLVHTLMLSNKDADEMIRLGQVELDGWCVISNCPLSEEQEIKVKGKIVRPRKELVYLEFHKPVGYESTLNASINANIAAFFEGYNGLAIAGRLDKASEGLLLLSNDGKWVEALCNPKFDKEKEYLVDLDKAPDSTFLDAFRSGVNIGLHKTKACECTVVQKTQIRVILTEGKNRQIRRMCRALGYKVLNLKRIRVDKYLLNGLEPGLYRKISSE